jgi:hypothetical protein
MSLSLFYDSQIEMGENNNGWNENENNGWPENEYNYWQEQRDWEEQLAQADAAEENFQRRQAEYEAEQNAARQAARNRNVKNALNNTLPNNLIRRIREFEGPVENRYVNLSNELPGNPWLNNNNNGAARKRKSTRRRKARKSSRRQRKNRK